MSKKINLGSASLIPIIDAWYNLIGHTISRVLRDIGMDFASSELTLKEIEGDVQDIGDGIVCLKVCPFLDAIENYKMAKGSVPKSIAEIADFQNSKGNAWVSAFCGIHQGIREKKGSHDYIHIACKSPSGKVNYAEQSLLPKEKIDEILRDNACIYRQ